MPKIIDEATQADLLPILAILINPVTILFFTQKNACPGCAQQEELLSDLVKLSDKLTLKVYDFVKDHQEVQRYKIERVPATAIVGDKDHGIRFYGLTAGFELSSLIQALLMVSTGQTNLGGPLEAMVRALDQPLHLKVMVTLTCHYCPAMVQAAHQFAFVNDKIRADMIELAEFPQIAQKYNVTEVPKTLVNETHAFSGALPPADVYLKIIQLLTPEKFPVMERELRRAQGTCRTREPEASHDYEVAIVGGGPAGMSAAVYAVRKGLDVLLVTNKIGGQMNYTADVDNYLGFMNVTGAELTEAFRTHVEGYPIAEAIDTAVTAIEKIPDGFLIFVAGKVTYRAAGLIYCAGKEYLRLGVPGEEKFIGRGIGFCATCDAPLYKGKRVAVVGGGNSAFTSVRDLAGFASEIHLISRSHEFKADAALVADVKANRHVMIHSGMDVRAFTGEEKLQTLRMESRDTKITSELAVDGVFLEIGLSPNNGPLVGLGVLDPAGQVMVDREQATGVPGLFAAGDITDTPEKQISIAVGQGAMAGIAAYKYLRDRNLTKSKQAAREAWE